MTVLEQVFAKKDNVCANLEDQDQIVQFPLAIQFVSMEDAKTVNVYAIPGSVDLNVMLNYARIIATVTDSATKPIHNANVMKDFMDWHAKMHFV